MGGGGGSGALADDSLFFSRAVDLAGGSSASVARSTATQHSSGPAGDADERGGALASSEAAGRDGGGGGPSAGVGRSGTRRDLVVAPALHLHGGLTGEVTAELSTGYERFEEGVESVSHIKLVKRLFLSNAVVGRRLIRLCLLPGCPDAASETLTEGTRRRTPEQRAAEKRATTTWSSSPSTPSC